MTGAQFAAATFLSSTILFFMEPLAGKRLLPLLGGSAAVWTTCLVFFQCALLLGYFVAHWLTTRTRMTTQSAVYVMMLSASLLQLAGARAFDARTIPGRPIASVLWLLTALIGVPFVTLSASSPLLQSWYARTRLRVTKQGAAGGGANAYRLFAISNGGSLLALLVYPLLVEPYLSVRQQGLCLIGAFAVLAGVCIRIARSVRHAVQRAPDEAGDATFARDMPPTPAPQLVLWVMLAACPSLLLSAVTIHLSQNVATIPLLWIIPLVAYLLSFVVAFNDGRWHPRGLVLGLCVMGLGGASYSLYEGDLFGSVPFIVAVFCGSLFAISLFCHGELYRRRPPPRHLTTFYFCLAGGGALGGIAVGVLAPSVLSGNYELVFGLVFAAVLGLAVTWTFGWFARSFWLLCSAALTVLCITRVRDDRAGAPMRLRNFYGTLHVEQHYDTAYKANVRTLYNGVIEHGQQVMRADLRRAPTTYYGHSAGVGLALDGCCAREPRRIGVIGLGAGTIAAYGRPGDIIRFYDINPAVQPTAEHYFTFLRDSPAHVEVIPGDARLALEGEAPQRYDVLVVDAFSGDGIPVHLITSEALALYKRHLRPLGIVAFHVSNRFLDLEPVVQQLADHAGMRELLISTPVDATRDLFAADWVLVTDNEAFLGRPEVARAAQAIKVRSGMRRWTDDYSSLLPVVRMRSSTP